MWHKIFSAAVFILLGTLLFDAVADAQGPKPGGNSRAPRAAAGNAFTYQGKLSDGGNPATGTSDFQFELFDNPSPSFGIQVGSTVTANNDQFLIRAAGGAGIINAGTAFTPTAQLHISSTGGDSMLKFQIDKSNSPMSINDDICQHRE